jgi:hypothetical protein
MSKSAMFSSLGALALAFASFDRLRCSAKKHNIFIIRVGDGPRYVL